MSKFLQVFAQNPKMPGRTGWVEHSIETNSANPVKQKSRRMPIIWEKKVDNQIEEMLENDIIRPSKSPWSSQILLVKKKDGTMRLVVDYRSLNDVTKKDSYSLPNIQDILDKMDGSQYWKL